MPADADAIAVTGVLNAFLEYLEKYNDGRGVELIGHSQGSAVLEELIRRVIEPNPALRKQLMRRYPKHAWPEDPTQLIDE